MIYSYMYELKEAEKNEKNVSCWCVVSFAITIAIWPREVVSYRDFILLAVATFWAMSLVGIYPGRASVNTW